VVIRDQFRISSPVDGELLLCFFGRELEYTSVKARESP
jgi:hypothetical protein